MTANIDQTQDEGRPNIIKTPKFSTAAADKPYRLYLMLIIECAVTLLLGGITPMLIIGLQKQYLFLQFLWNFLTGLLMMTEWILLFYY